MTADDHRGDRIFGQLVASIAHGSRILHVRASARTELYVDLGSPSGATRFCIALTGDEVDELVEALEKAKALSSLRGRPPQSFAVMSERGLAGSGSARPTGGQGGQR